MNPHSKYIIIGAGLSGLTTAYHLHQAGETDFVVLESRDQIGGRILTKNHIDLGATWFQTHHQNVIHLMDKLGLAKYHQYSQGKSVLVYSTMAPAHYFASDPNVPAAYRIVDGSIALIQHLAQPYLSQIKTETRVHSILEKEHLLRVETDQGTYTTEKVIVTLPPRIATTIAYTPELPPMLTVAMQKTHTWMSNAMKIGLTFKTPFWRNKNLSGTIIGQVGAVVELYDHTDAANEHYALMGFINEGLRDVSPEERKTRILDYLKTHLGEEVLSYLHYEEKDWSQDPHTADDTIKSIYMSPSYGNPLFDALYLNGKLLFSGAETSPVYGGYMDGAIYSGIRAAEKVISGFRPMMST